MKATKDVFDINIEPILEAAQRLKLGESFILVTVIAVSGSTPRKEGARMLVTPEGDVIGSIGGGSVEKLATDAALKSLVSGRMERLKMALNEGEGVETGMCCGGQMEILIEPFGTGPLLMLFGAGHVAQPTARLAMEVGFRVSVYDSREEWANAERFPGASAKVGKLEQIAAEIETYEHDFIAVMTHSHVEDYKVVKQIIRKPYYFFGVIGSPRKALEIRAKLDEDGFTSEEIARLTCPIGIDIGSHTPAEIAVSVAAQLISLKKDWRKST